MHPDLIVVAVPGTGRPEPEVQEVEAQLADWLLAVVAHGQVALPSWIQTLHSYLKQICSNLGGAVGQRGGVGGRGELELNIRGGGAAADHLGHDRVVQREAAAGVALFGTVQYNTVQCSTVQYSTWLVWNSSSSTSPMDSISRGGDLPQYLVEVPPTAGSPGYKICMDCINCIK